MDNNKQRTLMMDAALAFILSYGRDVQEAAVRKHLKATFPMTNEREQSVWIMSTFSNLEELRAIRRTGSMVGITQRGRRIVKRGGVKMNEAKEALYRKFLIVSKIIAVSASVFSVWATTDTSSNKTLHAFFAVILVFIAIYAIYSLLQVLLRNRPQGVRADKGRD